MTKQQPSFLKNRTKSLSIQKETTRSLSLSPPLPINLLTEILLLTSGVTFLRDDCCWLPPGIPSSMLGTACETGSTFFQHSCESLGTWFQDANLAWKFSLEPSLFLIELPALVLNNIQVPSRLPMLLHWITLWMLLTPGWWAVVAPCNSGLLVVIKTAWSSTELNNATTATGTRLC